MLKLVGAIALALAIFLTLCAQPAESPTTPSTPAKDLTSIYTGFKTLQKGEWAQWRVSNGEVVTLTYVFAGREKLNGKSSYGIEFSSEIQGKKAIVQVWFSEDGSSFKYVAKVPEGIFCFPFIQVEGEMPSPSTPDEYSPETIVKGRYEFGKHTVAGKTINVVKVFIEGNETWVSGEVPFGMVKVINQGKTVMELLDFGSGKTPEISFNEVLNCRQYPMMP
ncbi:MAG: hypothetical protein NZ879_05180 [Archaeoglobaceae archaeon]|nr:hypothetical protein [Archaeoglobaceae archaeon]MDW8118359.1 hypothetical protein [Archaeoglobaceae archaeon]